MHRTTVMIRYQCAWPSCRVACHMWNSVSTSQDRGGVTRRVLMASSRPVSNGMTSPNLGSSGLDNMGDKTVSTAWGRPFVAGMSRVARAAFEPRSLQWCTPLFSPTCRRTIPPHKRVLKRRREEHWLDTRQKCPYCRISNHLSLARQSRVGTNTISNVHFGCTLQCTVNQIKSTYQICSLDVFSTIL